MGVLTFGDNLTNFFHGDTLVLMWPDLSPRLPQEGRAVWEEQGASRPNRPAARKVVSPSCRTGLSSDISSDKMVRFDIFRETGQVV